MAGAERVPGTARARIRARPSSTANERESEINPKLVRDNIPEIIRAAGLDPVVYVAGSGEYSARLRDKLREEVAEFFSCDAEGDREQSLGELADVLEVVYALAEEISDGPAQLEQARAAKAARNGAFAKRLVWLGNR